jgi:hypothetical protein
MIRFFINIAFSVAIYNWACDELVLFDANFKEPVEQFTEKLRIPTHPDWFGGAGGQFFASMEDHLYEIKDSLFDEEYLRKEFRNFL